MARRLFKSGSENNWGAALQGVLGGVKMNQELEQMAAERALKRQMADMESRKQKLSESEFGLNFFRSQQGSTIQTPDGKTVTIPGLRGVTYDPQTLELNQGPNFDPGTKPGAVKTPSLAQAMTPGEKSVDQAFGKEYADYVAGGGSSEVKKNINQLDGVIKTLAGGAVKTGGVLGGALASVPTTKQNALLENVQQTVQTNLKKVLGSQFTAKEGEGIMSRAYNKWQEPEENLRRLNLLSRQIKEAAKAKEEAIRYFEDKGTLMGFKGKVYTASDFLNAMPEPKSGQPPSFGSVEEAEASGYKGPAIVAGRRAVID